MILKKLEKLVDILKYTLKTEIKMQKRYLEFSEKNFFKKVYDRIYPVVSQCPRMYGLPKIHKSNVPIRSILCMVGSAQHELAKWLVEILDPLLRIYSDYCIPDSFQFASLICKLKHSTDTESLYSFNTSNQFINVLLEETIGICADMFYYSPQNLIPLEKIFLLNR